MARGPPLWKSHPLFACQCKCHSFLWPGLARVLVSVQMKFTGQNQSIGIEMHLEWYVQQFLYIGFVWYEWIWSCRMDLFKQKWSYEFLMLPVSNRNETHIAAHLLKICAIQLVTKWNPHCSPPNKDMRHLDEHHPIILAVANFYSYKSWTHYKIKHMMNNV